MICVDDVLGTRVDVNPKTGTVRKIAIILAVRDTNQKQYDINYIIICFLWNYAKRNNKTKQGFNSLFALMSRLPIVLG